jgi:serine/threonine-protein kinase
MIGREIANYRITEKLGEGGMGVVYKAVDVNLDRAVAIKVLNSDLSRNPDLVERFRAEARAQANLNHTNLATLYSFLVHEGTAMMVMEFVDGETLEKMVQRRGPIPSNEAIPIFKQALLGIGHAHRMGIIHRDLKPANLMLGRNGIVKVMDFGIAKVLGTRGMTRTGTQMGTAFYMSPEQVLNKPVDIRSDIYSLGVTLYEMITGHVPFEADSDYQIMTSHVSTPPPLPTRFYPYIPTGVENAVLKAIEKNPEARFQTVEEFGQALEHPEDYVAPVAAAAAASPASTMVEGATRVTAAPPPTGVTQLGTAAPPPTGVTQLGTAAPPPTGVTQPGTAAPPATGATQLVTPTPEPLHAEAQGRFEGLLDSKRTLMALGAAVLLLVVVLIFALRPKPVPPAPSGPGSKGSGINQNTAPPPPQPNQNILGNETSPVATQEGTGAAAHGKPKRTSQTTQTQQSASQTQGQTGGSGTTGSATAPQVATIPAGTTLAVRMIDAIDAQQSQQGQDFHASVDSPVVVGNLVAIPKGADALVEVVASSTAGHFRGRSSLTVKLVRVSVRGRDYPASSQPYVAQASSRGKRSGEVIGGASAVGAAIGGIFGHKKKKDAAEGGAAGAGAGAVAQGATNPQEASIASEAVIQCVLDSPLTITLAQ